MSDRLELSPTAQSALDSVAGLARMSGEFVDEPKIILHLAPKGSREMVQPIQEALLRLEESQLVTRGNSASYATFAPTLQGWMASSSCDGARRLLEAILEAIKINSKESQFLWSDIRRLAGVKDDDSLLAKLLITAANLHNGISTDATGIATYRMPLDIVDIVHTANVDALLQYRKRESPARIAIRQQWRRDAPGPLQRLVPVIHQLFTNLGDWPSIAEAEACIPNGVTTALSGGAGNYVRVIAFDGPERVALTLTGLMCAPMSEEDQALALRLLKYLGAYAQRNALPSVSARVLLGAFGGVPDDDARTTTLRRAIRLLEHRPELFAGTARPFDLDQTRLVLTAEIRAYATATDLPEVIFAQHLTILAPASLPAGPIAVNIPAPGTTEDTIRVPNYVLGDRLGAGGSGEVFEAHEDWENGVACAIKILIPHPFSEDKDPIPRFLNEVKALRVLQHRAIVRYIQSGWTEGKRFLFVAMDLITGQTLRAVAQEMSYRARVSAIAEILDGLQHAHDRGVFHRDIKPSNVVVRTSDQQPVLVDFGLAFHADDDMTRTSSVIGTPGYIAPEVINDLKKSRTAKSDVFACGVTLYEILAGRHPKKDGYEALASVDPSLVGLDAIVLHAIGPEETRYETAHEMALQLHQWLSGEKESGTLAPSPGVFGLRARILDKRRRGQSEAERAQANKESVDRLLAEFDVLVCRSGQAALVEIAKEIAPIFPGLSFIDKVPSPHPFVVPLCGLVIASSGYRIVFARCANFVDPLAIGAGNSPIQWTKLGSRQVADVCWVVYETAAVHDPPRTLVAAIGAAAPLESVSFVLHGVSASDSEATPKVLANAQAVKDFLFECIVARLVHWA